MASSLKNLSEYKKKEFPNLSSKKIAIVVSAYHETITGALYEGAFQTLIEEGATEDNIVVKTVPGAYELSMGAQWMAADSTIDAVICLGCVILGETKHFDFICHAVSQGLTNVSLKYNKPVIFGVLTPNTLEQAQARAGGEYGNKGTEAAITAIEMLHF